MTHGAHCPYSTGEKWDMAALRHRIGDYSRRGVAHRFRIQNCKCRSPREADDGKTIRCLACGELVASADFAVVLAEAERYNAAYDAAHSK